MFDLNCETLNNEITFDYLNIKSLCCCVTISKGHQFEKSQYIKYSLMK